MLPTSTFFFIFANYNLVFTIKFTMEENQEQFISWIAAKLEAQDEDDLQKKLTQLGKDGIKQAYDQFLTETTKAKMALNGGKLDYIKSLKATKFQQGGQLQLTPEDRAHWNGFVDYVAQKGMTGNPALNQRNTGLSQQLFNDYNKQTGKKYNYEQFIPLVQGNINDYKSEMVNRINTGVVGSDVAPGTASTTNYMPGASKTDGWAGTKTTSTKFPAATLVKNGVTSQVNNNYLEQASPVVGGVVNNQKPGEPTYGYGPRNQAGDGPANMTQRQMTKAEWEQVRKETGWPDVYKNAGNTQSANTAESVWPRIDQILGRIRTSVQPPMKMDTPVAPQRSPLTPQTSSIAKNEEGGKLEYLRCLEEFKKGGKMGCGCGGMKLSMKKDKGGKLEASYSSKSVKGLNPKKVKMGQGADGVLGGMPTLKRQFGGPITSKQDGTRVQPKQVGKVMQGADVDLDLLAFAVKNGQEFNVPEYQAFAARKFKEMHGRDITPQDVAKLSQRQTNPADEEMFDSLISYPDMINRGMEKNGELQRNIREASLQLRERRKVVQPTKEYIQKRLNVHAQGGTIQQQPAQPNKGQAQGNGQAQMPSPEQIENQKIDMKATELLVKKNQRVDAMTPMDTLMQQLKPKQIKAPKEKTIKIMFDKGRVFGVED